MTSQKRLFHYTRANNLKHILQDRSIKTTNTLIGKNEVPTVWFSYRQDWEPTATPRLSGAPLGHWMSFNEFAKIETPVPIEVNPSYAPMKWPVWRKLSGVKAKTARDLESSAIRMKANVADWRMSFKPVTCESGAWRAIELFVGEHWQDIRALFPKPL